MPRQTRSSIQGEYGHITVRGSGRRLIFEDDEDRSFFISTLEKISKDQDCRIYAWSLMDNHVHILVKGSTESISKMMQRLLTSYSHRFNGRHGHVGHVFQGRYSLTPIDCDEHFLDAIRYIHKNPLELGIKPESIEEYPWSSYRGYLEGSGFCEQRIALDMLGGLDAFRAFHDQDEESIGIVSLGRRRMSDSEATDIARRICGESFSDKLPTLPKDERDAHIGRLKIAGLSVRQIERLTGVGRGIISRVKM